MLKYFIYFLIAFPIFLQGKNDDEWISQEIHLPSVYAGCSFKIEGESPERVYTYEEINQKKLSSPGTYQIHVINCEQESILEEIKESNNTIVQIIFIDTIKVIFDIESIKFSKPITANQLIEDNTLSINVSLEHYRKGKIKFDYNYLKFAGVEIDIQGELISTDIKEYQEGIYTMYYKLKGGLKYPGYYMIDFINPIGKRIGVSLPNKID